jgi:hypothetical protein
MLCVCRSFAIRVPAAYCSTVVLYELTMRSSVTTSSPSNTNSHMHLVGHPNLHTVPRPHPVLLPTCPALLHALSVEAC